MSPNTFLKTALTTLALCLFAIVASAADGDGRQYFELRTYTTKSEEQQKRINDYWQNAAVPAYNRLGVKNIGVFTEQADSPTNKIYVLLAFNSIQDFAAAADKLAADAAYKTAADAFLSAPKANPAYEKVESSLLKAFDSMKQMHAPPADKRSTIFELRTYISPSENTGHNKVKMFNDGETDVMKEVGLTPIFFGQTVLGSPMPSLVYMTSAVNEEEHKKHWAAFGPHPTWRKLLADPQYRDNMKSGSAGIIKVMLKSTPASQL
jgi:hypothetical protein